MHRYLIAALMAFTLTTSCKVDDVATAEEKTQMAALEEQAAAGDTGAAAELEAMETNIAERAVGGAFDFIDAFVPAPLAPFKEVMAGTLGLLLFKRPRKRLRNAAKSLGQLDVKGALGQTLAAVGLKHSSTDPLEIMRGAAVQARANGDNVTAIAIEAKIADIKAIPRTPA